jgi:glycosyltransferase involved in cell wall biosynthesis
MKPTVIHLCTSKSWGGLEMSAVLMARLFNRHGYPSVCVAREGSSIAEASRKEGLEVVAVSPRRKYFSYATAKTLRRTLSERAQTPGGVVVFVHYLSDLWYLAFALLGLNTKPKVFGVAQMFVKNVNKKGLLHRWVYGYVTRLIALGHRQKDFLLECLPLPEERYVVIPNHVDTKVYAPGPKNIALRETWGVRDDETLLGFCGRLDQGKGPEELIAASAKLLKDFPKLKIVLVGRAAEPTYENKLRELALAAEPNKGRIVFAGHRDDMPQVFRALDLFIMPSYEEAFGFVLIEAMATGIPAISTKAGGVPEIIEHKNTGYLIEPRSAAAIEAGVRDILSNADLRARLIKNGQERAERVYDSEIFFRKVEDLLV